MIGGPAPRPCESCPYRRDVPAGVWAAEEYEKLVRYDAPTPEQPPRLFQCHQSDAGSAGRRVCAGWAGCHGDGLLAPRIAVIQGRLDAVTYRAIAEYVSPVPLFSSGAEAAEHGLSGISEPGAEARRVIGKITRVRSDLSQS
ncbi:DUF6283 family protein [Kitasatospora sp. NPDC093679]|uniref:DUF6283 family protein n=1 Tax=Kitasatospora sp. NPDC093679 TaxID=3154983 RepID=UPI003420AE82